MFITHSRPHLNVTRGTPAVVYIKSESSSPYTVIITCKLLKPSLMEVQSFSFFFSGSNHVSAHDVCLTVLRVIQTAGQTNSLETIFF